MTSAPAIAFEVQAAAVVAWVLALIAALALIAIGLSAVPLGLRLLLMAATAIGSALTITAYLRQPICHVLWRSDGGCQLELRDGSDTEAELSAARVLGAWVFLRFAWGRRKRATIWLLGPNSSADVRRRLRVRISAFSSTRMPDT